MRKYILAFVLLAICIGAFAQNKSYTFVFLNNKPDKEVLSKEKSDSIMQGHMNNIGRLAKEGKLLAAGPFEGGGGIFILNTTSVDEANQWLSTDPGVKAKRWNLEVLPVTIHGGDVCPVGEKYEMVFYQFSRFTEDAAVVSKVNYSQLMKDHYAFLKSLETISQGTFGEHQGGIIIFGSDIFETIKKDPAVVSGLLKYEIKKLYIAKGSFCEK
jgi:uncharacterized protein YciI